jgi:2-hydroxy-6-oxonona-2,4-dienedioate hydrolase
MSAVEIRSAFAEMSHGRTHYYEAGSGPDVILIHGAGFLSGAHSWLPVIPALAEHLHVYAIDCLGFGIDTGLDQGYSFAYLVDHVREFQDTIGLQRTNIVGSSMGGWIGVLLAYESPQRLERFVNVAGGGASTRPLRNMVGWNPPSEEEVRASMERLVALHPDVKEVADLLVEKAKDPAAVARFRRLMDHMTDHETRRRYNTLRRFPRISTPTLVLWGSNDQTNALELGQQAHELIPGSKMVVIAGAGHGLWHDRPNEFCDEVINFLA